MQGGSVLAILRALALLVLVAASASRATAASVQVDFEGGTAPCGFASTTALRTLASAPGVTFGSTSALAGGAVLDACATFGVAPRSGDSFLAFNRGGIYLGGGRAIDPEQLSFEEGASRVSIWASGGARATSFLMEAFGAGDVPLGSDEAEVGPGAWGLLELAAAEIRSIRLRETGGDNSFVFDDLSYDTIPEPATGLLLAIALAGSRGRRARS
jgi:hypothetical protein